MWETSTERLIRRNSRIDCTVRHSRRDCRATHGSQQTTLKCLHVRRIHSHQVSNASRQDVAEQAEAGSKNGIRFDLPRDAGSGLQNRQWGGCEDIPQTSLNHVAERLIDIVRDGIERAVETGNLVMRIQRVGIVGIAQAERPSHRFRDPPRILGIEIEIEKVERLVRRCGECLRGRRRHAVDELRQRRVGDGWDCTFAEVEIIQAKDSGVGAEPQLMSAMAPCQIVVDEETGSAPSLQPSIVESSNGGEGCIGAHSLQHNRKCSQRRGKIAWRKQARIPGERRIEVVHQILGEDVRVSRRKRIERLRGKGVENGIDGIGPGSLQSGIGLKTKPCGVVGTDVVVDTGGLHLLVIVTGVRQRLCDWRNRCRWEDCPKPETRSN